jgi:predicted ATPase
VRLFAERARAAKPGFTLNDEGRRTVAQICRRLDGIPLAVELAAVRARVLSPGQIAARLDDRFRLLIEGNRGAVPRHRTLRATLDWSHVLLAESERMLLRRLSVFAGGATLDAIRAVCFPPDTPEWEVVNGLSALADQSLLRVDVACGSDDDDVPAVRYTLLETVRQYAAERLESAGETERTVAAHRSAYRALAEEAAAEFKRPGPIRWLDRLDMEQGNLRAALRSSLEAAPVNKPAGPVPMAAKQALIDGP